MGVKNNSLLGCRCPERTQDEHSPSPLPGSPGWAGSAEASVLAEPESRSSGRSLVPAWGGARPREALASSADCTGRTGVSTAPEGTPTLWRQARDARSPRRFFPTCSGGWEGLIGLQWPHQVPALDPPQISRQGPCSGARLSEGDRFPGGQRPSRSSPTRRQVWLPRSWGRSAWSR